MSEEMDLDWYTYLTEDFKLDRKMYTVNDRAVFDCPKCGKTSVVRINHAKAKIKKLGKYECSTCRKRASIKRARSKFKEKHGVENPWQLKGTREKIAKTVTERYGVDNVLKLPEVHKKGIEAAAKRNLKLRKIINNAGMKECPNCNITKELNQFRDPNGITQKTWCKKCKNWRFRQIVNNDLNFKLSLSIRTALTRSLVKNKSYKQVERYLGCTISQFKKYLEAQFQLGMGWDNYGEWHIDHIIPLSKFNLSNPDSQKIACHFSNLQPLWAVDNLKKGNKLPQVYLIAGCFGSGKSTISNKFDKVATILDKDFKHTLHDAAKSDLDKPVIFQVALKAVATIKEFRKYFDGLEVVVIQEPEDVIVERIKSRNGRINLKTIDARIRRMRSIAKNHSDFTGTADECLEYLKKKIPLK